MAEQDHDEERVIYGYFEQKGDALCYRYEAERLIIEPWGTVCGSVPAKMVEMPQEDWALPACEKTPRRLRSGTMARSSQTA